MRCEVCCCARGKARVRNSVTSFTYHLPYITFLFHAFRPFRHKAEAVILCVERAFTVREKKCTMIGLCCLGRECVGHCRPRV